MYKNFYFLGQQSFFAGWQTLWAVA